MSEEAETKYHHCSFCGKHQDYVRTIVAGLDAMICDECISICADIVADARRKKIAIPEKESAE